MLKRTHGLKRLLPVGIAGVAVALLLAACSGSPGGGGGNNTAAAAGTSSGKVVTISNASGSTWTCGFNPFNANVNLLSFGLIYEPLIFVNSLENDKTTPWLATAYAWSNDNRTLTFTLRSGVKWTDGKPFSAADVVYTFNLMKQHSALDLNAVWSVLSGVTQQGSDQVVFTFKSPAVQYFYFIADQVGIVPQHIWSKVSKPVTYNDSNPVGTGPFEMSQCTPQNVTYTKNTSYWQPGLPRIDKIEYPAFTSNDTANNYLSTGLAQWGGQFIPNIQRLYTSKSPNYHYWFPPTSNVDIFPNLTNPVLSNLAVREAIAYGVDRKKVSQIGEYGYEPPSNQTSIVTPTFASWLDSAQASTYGNNYAFDPSKAISVLEAAGYKRGSDGIFVSPTGKKLSFTIINISDYPDWVASVQVIQNELKAVGIQITPDNLSSNDYDNELYNGKYELAYGAENGGPSPYYELYQLLYSANSAPIGQSASTNWERYHSASTDALLNQYATTTDAATEHSIVNQLQGVMLKEVPVIPVTEQVDFYQYDTSHISGWADPSNPLAQPAPFNTPDIEVMLLHLTPK
jgi:peptide/nickel transport system substrate-binding protein